MTTTTCPICGAPAETTHRTLTGEAGDVGAVVEGVPATVCDEDHAVAVPDVVARLVAAVGDLLPRASGGRLRRTPRCGACGEPLTMPPRRTERTVSPEVDGHVVTVTFDLPMVRCAECGTDQAPREIGTGGALAALRAALTPSS